MNMQKKGIKKTRYGGHLYMDAFRNKVLLKQPNKAMILNDPGMLFKCCLI